MWATGAMLERLTAMPDPNVPKFLQGPTVFDRMSALARAPRWLVPEARGDIRPIEPLPSIEGGWPCIAADPAWKTKNWSDPETEEQQKAYRGAERHYATMTLDEIMAMPVKDIAARDAHCFLWITGPFLKYAEAVLNSWGFQFSTDAFVWIKLLKSLGADQGQLMTLAELIELLNMGPGKTTRKNAEFCILGRRGNPKRLAKDVFEVIVSPRQEHSRKPLEFYERVERYCPGPRLDLFSRQQREGWTAWGNETWKFSR